MRFLVSRILILLNTYLMEKASLGHPHASVAATHIQTKGRGRRGRSWQSALGESLTFSLLWRFNGGAATLSGLSLAVGVAIIRSLHRFGVLSAQLKWPNDVLFSDNNYNMIKLTTKEVL